MTATQDRLYVAATRRYGALSPLRYPGGKAALAGVFEDLIRGMRIKDATYVEPYAGGVGAGIALLRRGTIKELVINDIDPAVHSFWVAVTKHTSELISMVRSAVLNVEEWKKQKDIYKKCDTSDPLGLGFAFFYLNRTNRSGILHAGVIGGKDQLGNYKIDARFNRATLLDRLQEIGKLAGQISVSDLDGRTVISKYSLSRNVFMYIDPPYVRAGSQLYLNAFDRRDHVALADVVNSVDRANWIMTYDVSPLIEALYEKHFQCRLALNYSARHPGAAEELVIASRRTADALRHLTT